MVFKDVDAFMEYADNKLPQSENEAKDRYKKYKNEDPYPEIEPALLNTEDIFKYVCTTGMIYPFHPVAKVKKEDKKYLAGASYEVGLEGEVVYWDGKGKKINTELKNDKDSFNLLPNSIAFVTLEPFFQIPNYLALRFNLKISHIYKGLLLGTGPLVDPGFVGKLSIPLHNLTVNEYTFKKGDGLIQLEFTKLSRRKEWECKKVLNEDKVLSFYIENEIDSDRQVDEYIEKALKGNSSVSSVRSSIPDAIEKSSKNAEEAKDSANKAKGTAQKITIGGFIGALIAAVGLIVALVSLFNDINGRIDNLYKQNEVYRSEITILENVNKHLQEKVDKLNSNIDKLESVHSNENKLEKNYIDKEH